MTAADNKLNGWVLELGKVDYRQVLGWQQGLVKMRREGMARDTLIFVEHPPVVTIGRDGHRENYCNLKIEPIHIDRGGDVTYHGPGQLVVYFVFNLTRRGRDLHLFMLQIQNGIIGAMKQIGIDSRLGDEHTGVWTDRGKIASIGVAVKNWISFHGAAVNLNTNLKDFEQIKPCGLSAEIMTSAQSILGKKVDMDGFRKLLLKEYTKIFDTTFYSVALDELAEDIESQAGGYTI
jgi:lipoate-protein ligase B